MMKQNLRSFIKSLLLGLGAVVLMVGFLFLVTLDLRGVYILGIICMVVGGYLVNRLEGKGVLKFIGLNFLPMVFIYLTLAELPQLYFMIPVFIAASIVGYFLKFESSARLRVGLLVMSLIAMSWVGVRLIPYYVQSQLTEVVEESLPDFQFESLNGQLVSNENLEGSITIVDFFGTWCRPCIPEMKDLAALKESYEQKGVVFYAVSSGQGGDTIEKVAKFKTRMGFDFVYGFDADGLMHKSFGFTGVPALVIIDDKGKMRLKHEGYNASEDFESVVKAKLDELLSE